MAPATSNSRPSRSPSSVRPEPPAGAAFRGWPPEAIHFWEGLEADNSKTYWTAHRQLYEDAVRAPMEALGLACADVGPFRIFRPYRDVRFSRDKSPYKTHIGAVTESDGGTAYYVQHSAAGLYVAAGFYHLAADQLERYRKAVAGDAGEEVEGVLAALRRAGYEIGGEALKSAPRGYPRDHPRIGLLRHKGLYMGAAFRPTRWLSTRSVLDRVRTVWSDAAPLAAWLERHVGPSTLPPE
jgi:uncharacterized protein (TIGR02453 family)